MIYFTLDKATRDYKLYKKLHLCLYERSILMSQCQNTYIFIFKLGFTLKFYNFKIHFLVISATMSTIA